MRIRKQITGIFSAMGLLILILDGETALCAASAGIELCCKTIVPSLFPFLFLCSLLTQALWGGQAPWMETIGRRLGIPRGAESILIAATLGGYPAGAQIIGAAHQNESLHKEDADHLLAFCSNAGPAFLFGMVSAVFTDKTSLWALWVIQILSAAMTAVTLRHIPKQPASLPASDYTVSDHLFRTVRTMAAICGWVILFRLLTGFLEKWVLFRFSPELQVIITGLLELAGGCLALGRIASFQLRFVICSLFLSFGGLCVAMQTLSAIGKLSFVPYLTGKLRQCVFSLLMSLLYLGLGWAALAVMALFLCILPVGCKKRSGFPSVQGV